MTKIPRIAPSIIATLFLLSLTACEQKKQEAPVTSAQNASGDGNSSLLHSRAVEAVIWGMPAVNYDLMLQEMLTKTSGKVGQVIYWGTPTRLAQPDPDAQPRRPLLHGFL